MARQNLNIQALRAVAALLVVIGHSAHETLAISASTGRPAVDLGFFNWAIGVDIFFVISGFIMVYSSSDLFDKPSGWMIFLIRRITRIVPLYWLLTTVLLVGASFAPSLLNVPLGDWRHILASYLFIPAARVSGETSPVLSLGWTLNMEMFFYALFAIALTMPFRRGMIALSAMIVGFATFGFIAKPDQVQMAFWTRSIILEFLFGCLLAIVFLKGFRISLPAAIFMALLAFGGMFTGAGSSQLPEALRWGIPAVLLVAAAAFLPSEFPRVLAFMAVLGNASYSLYLVHPFILRPFRNVWLHTVAGKLPLAVYVAVAVVVSALVSIVLYKLIEAPLQRLSRRAFAGRSTQARESNLEKTA